MSKRYSLEDTIYDLPGEGLHISPPTEQTCYDLRTPKQQAADELAAVNLRVDKLVDALYYAGQERKRQAEEIRRLTTRVEALERGNGND
jgi:hypothetical protein